jgi:hypothetical protein
VNRRVDTDVDIEPESWAHNSILLHKELAAYTIYFTKFIGYGHGLELYKIYKTLEYRKFSMSYQP